MAYDKGNAQGVTRIGHGVYAVESFKQEGKTYQVSLIPERCTCPAFLHHGPCKHLQAARAERYRELTEKARTLPTERLEELLSKYESDRAIWTAIQGEIHDRQQSEVRTAELKALFA